MQFSALLTALVAASLKQEFNAAQITEGFGRCGALNQPFVSAKLQMDKNGSVRGMMKDLSAGKLIYTVMDFAKSGVPLKRTLETKEAGKKFAAGISWGKIADPFVAPPQEKEPECDTLIYSQRLSHEGASAAQIVARKEGANATRGGVLTKLVGGKGSEITSDDLINTTDNDDSTPVTVPTGVQVLEVYKVARPSEDRLCLSILRRDPAPSSKSRIPEGTTLKEQCKEYAEASKDELIKVVEGFSYSEETSARRSKSQTWEMCFGELCTKMNKVAKNVRITRRQPREGKEDRLRQVRVSGSFIYKFYKNNENKREVVEFETMNKECVNAEELPSPSAEVKFSKCGETVKAEVNGFVYLMSATKEATNGQTMFNPKAIAPVDTKANDDFAKGVVATQATTLALVNNNGVIAAPLATSAAFMNFAVLALLF